MNGISVLVDVSRCIGCRSCQVACKQWNQLPAEKTKNRGSFQNPPDLSDKTYTLIRFNETEEYGKTKWTFIKRQCFHCIDPSCKYSVDEISKDAIQLHETGAVLFTERTNQLGNYDVKSCCPWEIPNKNKENNQWVKCQFCYDRVSNGLEPACVKACPTGTLTFGNRKDILKLAKTRLNEIVKTHPNASLLDVDDVRWIYLLHEEESVFNLGMKQKEKYYGLKRLINPINSAWIAAGSLAMLFKWRERGMHKQESHKP